MKNNYNMEQKEYYSNKSAYTAERRTKKSPMKWLLLLAALLLLPTFAMAQEKVTNENANEVYVKFGYVHASKTYPEGNQITYVNVSGLPKDRSVVDEMRKFLLRNMRINRVNIYSDQDRFVLDADADVNPEHVVDEMNIFLRKYYEEQEKIRELNKDKR